MRCACVVAMSSVSSALLRTRAPCQCPQPCPDPLPPKIRGLIQLGIRPATCPWDDLALLRLQASRGPQQLQEVMISLQQPKRHLPAPKGPKQPAGPLNPPRPLTELQRLSARRSAGGRPGPRSRNVMPPGNWQLIWMDRNPGKLPGLPGPRLQSERRQPTVASKHQPASRLSGRLGSSGPADPLSPQLAQARGLG